MCSLYVYKTIMFLYFRKLYLDLLHIPKWYLMAEIIRLLPL